MLNYLIEDLDSYSYRLGLPKWTAPFMIFLYPATWPIVVYRFGNWVFKKVNVFLIRQILFVIYFIFKRLTEILTGIEIAHNAEIGEGIFLGHIGGVIICNGAKVGKNSSFHEGVTIGVAGRGNKFGRPSIGDNVYFGAGSKIIGNIEIGNNVLIGANAVVTKNIPENASLGGIPANIINYDGSLEFIHYRGKK